jgi:hypothetical protein
MLSLRFCIHLSAITNRKILVLKISIKPVMYNAVVMVHAICVLISTLHPFEAVIFNYYPITNFFPYLPIMHVE